VLDLSRVLAGPWSAQLLADLGAEVIKVERPGTGDDTRSWGPPFLKDKDGNETRESAYYLTANRGKKSVAIDFSKPDGAALIKDLAAKADILIENYKVGGLAGYGLDYDSLKEACPGLIYCSITGYGQTGPYAQRAGYDFVIQGQGGLMSVTGEADDKPGGGPQKVGIAIADILTGMYAGVAVLAALAHREQSGAGQHIDLALLDCLIAAMGSQNMNHLISGEVPGRLGNAHANIVPYQVFESADGHLVVGIGNDRQFRRFCDLAGVPEVAADERFASNQDRVRNRDALIGILAGVIAGRTTVEWTDALAGAGIPGGPVNDLAAVMDDPQVRARGLFRELPHPLAGTVWQSLGPMRFSETPLSCERAPPTLGADTEVVLGDLLGLDSGRLAALRKGNVIS